VEPVSITINALRKAFGQTVAVDNVDLEVEPGQLFFLLGPSGCGKTTLLRMLAGFTDPTSGSIRFGDKDVTHLPPHKRNTGMVFQGYALWPHMTVRQNVAFGLDVRKVPAEEKSKRVNQALSMVQMGPYADRKTNQLSGGQQQRVALARAIVVEPTVLLLDEPLSNLDAKLRADMRMQIRSICKQAGITGVYVTHDQKEALSMADGIAVLNNGNVMQVGPPREVYDRPTSRFVADFLGETNFIPAEVKGREGDTLLLETIAGTLRSAVFPDDLPDKGNVTCSVRPEAIRLLHENATPEPGSNHVTATRAGLTYLGEMAQYKLKLTDDLDVSAFELNPRTLEPEGKQLTIAFDPQDTVVLQD